MADAEARWYVAHTYSGYENKVKMDIEKTIENRGLQDQILEVSVPMLEVAELKNGVEKLADKKMFPGYVLIHMIMNDDTWYVVRNTRGVTGFVGPGSKPVPLSDEEMERRIRRLRWKLRKGVDIVVTHAPVRGFGDLPTHTHEGFGAFLGLIDRYHPRYLLHGHVHQQYTRNPVRELQYGGTTLINVCGTYVLEIPDPPAVP